MYFVEVSIIISSSIIEINNGCKCTYQRENFKFILADANILS